MLLEKLLDHACQSGRPVWNFAEKPHLAGTPFAGDTDGDRRLLNIQVNERDSIFHGPSPGHEARRRR
ncbi:hypothetical protein [Azospirillum endophyticum]